jgi:tRNA (cmo5U34)-methyltransferase
VILSVYPEAKGVLLDISEHMIEAAREKLQDFKNNLDFIVYDYSNKDWIEKVKHKNPYDVIVSGLSIHHQPDERKKELYKEIYDLLNLGGIFINIEHVESPTKWVSSLFNDCFVDSLYNMHKKKDGSITREKIAEELYNRADKEANILSPVEDQCKWLREIGFKDVDCYFKIYELSVFGGRKII